MATTRKRVNLTLTEPEERFLDAITTKGTAEHDALVRHLGPDNGGGAAVPELAGSARSLGVADVVHVVLRLGLDQLEQEMAEISYAAEAGAGTEEDRAAAEFLQANLMAARAPGDG